MSSGTCWHCEGDHDTGDCPTRKQWTKGEHQPGSPGVDLDALERRLELDLGSWGNLNTYRRVFAELRTLRARVGELEAENARLDRFRQLALADVEKARLKAEQYDRDWYGLRGEFEAAKARAESAEARVTELEKLFDDAGQGEHNVLALIDHYQSEAMAESEARRAALARVGELECAEADLESQLAAAREEQGLEAQVAETLGARFMALSLVRLFSGTWRAEWEGELSDVRRPRPVMRAHAADLPALLRAILEVEARS